MELARVLKHLPKSVRKQIDILKLAHALVKDKKSYLVVTGYVNSKIHKEIKDINGNFVPWMNYPMIAFLRERMSNNLKIIEYGSGASTMFFAKEGASVVSIEYNEEWFVKIQRSIQEEKLDNVKLHYSTIGNGYTSVGEFLTGNEKFDIAVIDGKKRVETAINCYKVLSEDGVVILDDSDRKQYQEIFKFYLSKGFNHLSFEGIKPEGGVKTHKTTVFYRRSNNCFGI